MTDPGGVQRIPLHPRPEHQQDRVHRIAIRYPRIVTPQRVRQAIRQQQLDALPQPIRHTPAIITVNKSHRSSFDRRSNNQPTKRFDADHTTPTEIRPKTLGLLAVGVAVTVAWIAVEARSRNPLVDMTMMRIRGVWTTNASAFLLGAGMYASFIVIPQIAQLPKSTGFGFGASVVVSGLYLLPATIGMTILGLFAGRISVRFGSRAALLAGTAFSTASFALLAIAHNHPYDLLIAAGLLGVGVGLAFAALGNLIVQAVSPHQTGVASGMNTVMRTLGGALGGQLSATFIATHTIHGEPAVTGFTETFLMATGFLLICLLAGFLVPKTMTGTEPLPTEAHQDESTAGIAAAEGARA
jgi:MFS family permease